MKIFPQTGLLNVARQIPSPNHDDRSDESNISLIVLHNISLPPNKFGASYINDLFTNQLEPKADPFFAEICHLRVSSHLLIQRDGKVVQYVPFHKRAWHAGVSSYQGKTVCNDFSIGIEMEGTDFEPFEEAQYQQLAQIIPILVKTYPDLSTQHITGHQHIAPERKTDPGPYFDWQRLSTLFDQKLPSPTNITGVLEEKKRE